MGGLQGELWGREIRERMSIALQMSAESEVLYVKASGAFSLAEAKRKFIDLMEAVAHTRTNKVLFDGRGLEGEPEFIERFYYGEFVAHTVSDYMLRGECRAPKFAYVLKEPVLDPRRFGEDVAVNRGMRLKVFDNLTEARTWLDRASAQRAA